MTRSVGIVDLTSAVQIAYELCKALQRPMVIAGGLALAAHGYLRATSDIDIVIPVVIGESSGDYVEETAYGLGLAVKARHGFGGLELTGVGDVARIDVLTLDRDGQTIVIDAVAEALHVGREVDLYGYTVHVISIGYLITMKMLAERSKDKSDITELIRTLIVDGTWENERGEVIDTVQHHLGKYAANQIRNLARTIKSEIEG